MVTIEGYAAPRPDFFFFFFFFFAPAFMARFFFFFFEVLDAMPVTSSATSLYVMMLRRRFARPHATNGAQSPPRWEKAWRCVVMAHVVVAATICHRFFPPKVHHAIRSPRPRPAALPPFMLIMP